MTVATGCEHPFYSFSWAEILLKMSKIFYSRAAQKGLASPKPYSDWLKVTWAELPTREILSKRHDSSVTTTKIPNKVTHFPKFRHPTLNLVRMGRQPWTKTLQKWMSPAKSNGKIYQLQRITTSNILLKMSWRWTKMIPDIFPPMLHPTNVSKNTQHFGQLICKVCQ